MVAIAALAIAAALAAADAGAPPASDAPPLKPPKADPPDRVVCRREPDPGSRRGGHKTCMTRRDWNDRDRQTAQDLRDENARGRTFQLPPP